MSDEQAMPEVGSAAGDGIEQIPAAVPALNGVQESPTVAVARDRLVEAIGREAVFLADQRAGQASEQLEALARAFALMTGPSLGTSAASVADPARSIGQRDIAQQGYDAYN
ncbi:hypothetical protein [Streptomyces xanthophaeus]